MIENSSTLYKMIILYMLEKVSFPSVQQSDHEFLSGPGIHHLFSCAADYS